MIRGDILKTVKDLNLELENSYLLLAIEGDLCVFVGIDENGVIVCNQSGKRSGIMFTIENEMFDEYFILKPSN